DRPAPYQRSSSDCQPRLQTFPLRGLGAARRQWRTEPDRRRPDQLAHRPQTDSKQRLLRPGATRATAAAGSRRTQRRRLQPAIVVDATL
ncbi:FIG00960186: hypothetical protein, partial [Pseudomonas fluorescens]